MKRARNLGLALLLAVLADLLVWALPNRPQALPHPWSGPVESVSFAPYHRGQSPLTKTFPSQTQIDADLKFLAAHGVKGVRTYTSLEGMGEVPALAKKYGLHVMQGAWLSPRLDKNALEIQSLIAAANAHPHTVTRVIVGNEVLLRRDLKADQLVRYIRYVRAHVRQPVTYADVWEFWLKNPQVAQAVDFITVHILPYWEDDPTPVAGSMAHIDAILAEIHKAFPGKKVLIGETGWPSAGRSRNNAIPGRVAEATYLSDFLNLAARQHLDYNVIEAFDQPWKAAQEGVVGANWGLFTVDRAPKFSLAGPVEENPAWPWLFAASALLGIGGALWAAKRMQTADPARLWAATALAQILAAFLTEAAFEGWVTSFTLPVLAWSAAKLAAEAVLAAALLDHLAAGGRWSLRGPDALLAASPWGGAWARWGETARLARWGETARLARWGETARLALSLAALVLGALLVSGPRYREFPIPDFTIPALVLPLVLGWAAGLGRVTLLPGPRWADAVLAAALALEAVIIAVQEALANLPHGPVHVVLNREALVWSAMMLLLALPHALAARRRAALAVQSR